MKRQWCLLALAASLVTAGGGEAISAAKTVPLQPAFNSVGDTLISLSLRYRINRRVRASRYRTSAFSRGPCPVSASDFSPIIPAMPESTAMPSYLNASAHPVFFVEVPGIEGASGTLFVERPGRPIRSRQLYKVEFDLPSEPGILGIRMPELAPSLQNEETYRWRTSVECSPDDRELNVIIFTGGVLEQVADTESSTAQEQLDYYLQADIWQSTLEVIAEERYARPSASADENWAALMEASGLPEFSETEIIDIIDGRLLE